MSKLIVGPEHVAKAIRRADLMANETPEHQVPDDYWENEDTTPEWLRDDYRFMAGAAMQAMQEPEALVDPESPIWENIRKRKALLEQAAQK